MNVYLSIPYNGAVVRHFQDYAEPDASKAPTGNSWRQTGNNPLHPPSKPDDGKDGLPPLDESILSRNLGIPIVVVITKVIIIIMIFLAVDSCDWRIGG